MSCYPPRPRPHHRGLPSFLHRSMVGPSSPSCPVTSVAASSASTASSSQHATWTPRLHHTVRAVPKPAKSRKTHSSQSVARGFLLRGLSGAYRQPKLFTVADRPLLAQPARKRTSHVHILIHEHPKFSQEHRGEPSKTFELRRCTFSKGRLNH